MLYWAEGSKCRNSAKLTNSDADLLLVFRHFLTECYAVPPERLRLSVNCFLNNGLDLDAIERWWLARLELPRSCLRGAVVNRPSSAGQAKRRTLPYGTARITLDRTAVVQSIYGAIQEYAGIERPEWLD